jgi:hypothetical protein
MFVKKNKIILCLLILCGSIEVHAQENETNDGKSVIRTASVLEAGHFWNFVRSSQRNVSDEDSIIPQFTGIYYSILAFKNQVVALGTSTGLELEEKKNIFRVPLTTEVRFNLFPKRTFQPSILVGWGLVFSKSEYDHHSMADPQFKIGVGVKGKLNKRSSFLLDIGYNYREYNNIYEWNLKKGGYLFVRAGVILVHKKRRIDKENDDSHFSFYH